MRKVLVIGSGGAGKSIFSRRLSDISGIELIHLDKIYWRPNWTEPSKEDWQKVTAELLKKEAWIIDGNYGSTMKDRFAACDTVIFLDLPRVICLYRVLKRFLLYKKNVRPDMADGCQEKIDWEFLSWIWNFAKNTKPKIEKLLEQFKNEKKIIHLRSRAEVADFFVNLK